MCEENSIMNDAHVDDWSAKLSIIASDAKYFICFREGEKIVSKSTNILEKTTILQLSQKYLIFHSNV